MSPLVTLSTASTYPESTAAAFEMAARLGYDGVEVMVLADAVSQDPEALLRLRDHYGIPIMSIHAPCLLISQRVWGSEPWPKLQRAQAAAELLGAATVVVHPPFRWQRDYAREFVAGIETMANETDVRFAVENMFPWRAASREFAAYLPELGRARRRLPPHDARPLAHLGVGIRRAGDGARPRRAARARPPRRRLGLEPRRAPGARTRQPAVRRAAARPRGVGLRRPGRRRDLHAQGRSTAPSARPTSPSPSRSPASTSPTHTVSRQRRRSRDEPRRHHALDPRRRPSRLRALAAT